jgi:hypothetical protein
MRLLTKAAVLATIAALAVPAIASAHRLRYTPAHNLALKLGVKQTKDKDHPIDSWRIFGAQRTSEHQIVWVYNVDYSDGTLCDAQLVVRYVNAHPNVMRAFFRNVDCQRP